MVEDVLVRADDLVAVHGLQVVLRVQARQLADVAADRVGLGHDDAVDLQHRQRAEAQRAAPLAELRERQALVLEVDAGRMKRDANRLAAATVEIEIGQFVMGHRKLPQTRQRRESTALIDDRRARRAGPRRVCSLIHTCPVSKYRIPSGRD